jgi:CheY-like chemotaxis protein
VATERGRLLLLLASGGPQSAAALAETAHEDPAETLRRLQQLVTEGFIVADTGAAIAVYRLVRSPDPLAAATALPRILVVDDYAVTRDLVVEILQDEAYAVAALESPTTVPLLLEHLQFGLVITDSFGPAPAAALVETAAMVAAAGSTPVALFTAHRVDLDAARVAGFRDVLAKPFDLETFLATVRDLLPPSHRRARPRAPRPTKTPQKGALPPRCLGRHGAAQHQPPRSNAQRVPRS